jgi:hypothetical protein
VTVYWLDADACIQAKHEQNGAFPFSRMPQFWDYLSKQVDNGVVKCPKMVYDEIVKGNDQLAEWFREREDRGLSVNANEDVWQCVTKISDYVVRKYKDRKSRKFLAGADMFVIAHAMAMGKDGVVVSHEGMRRQNALVKIPALCLDLKVEQIHIFQMLNRMNWRP